MAMHRLLLHERIVRNLEYLITPQSEGELAVSPAPTTIKGVSIGDITWDIEGGGKAFLLSGAVVQIINSPDNSSCTISFNCLRGSPRNQHRCHRVQMWGLFGGIFLSVAILSKFGGELARFDMDGPPCPEQPDFPQGIDVACQDKGTEPFSAFANAYRIFDAAFSAQITDRGYPDPKVVYSQVTDC